jgi:hypothetical protein
LSERSISVERTVSEEFDRVEVSVVGVQVELGQTHSGITLSAEPDVIEKISTKVVNGTLVVKPKRDSSFSTNVPIQVSFSAQGLRGVVASAGARVEINGLAGESFEAEAASGAQVTARGNVVSLRGVAKSGGIVDLSRVRAVNVSSQCKSGGVVRAG